MESLENFGTTAFSDEIMHNFVGYGMLAKDENGMYYLDEKREPHMLNFHFWIMTIPLELQDPVHGTLETIDNRVSKLHKVPSDRNVLKDMVIKMVQREIFLLRDSGALKEHMQ